MLCFNGKHSCSILQVGKMGHRERGVTERWSILKAGHAAWLVLVLSANHGPGTQTNPKFFSGTSLSHKHYPLDRSSKTGSVDVTNRIFRAPPGDWHGCVCDEESVGKAQILGSWEWVGEMRGEERHSGDTRGRWINLEAVNLRREHWWCGWVNREHCLL